MTGLPGVDLWWWPHAVRIWQISQRLEVWHVLMASVGLGVTLGGLARLNRMRLRRRTTHGSARFASRRELRTAGLFGPRGMPIGRVRGHVLRHAGHEHVLLCGATGSMKTRRVMRPIVQTFRGHVLVGDPKDGELLAMTGEARRALGDVAVFAPANRESLCLNISDLIRLESLYDVRDASSLSHSLLGRHNARQVESESSVYFRTQATALLTAAWLHVLYTKPRQSLAGVLDCMSDQEAALKEMQTALHVRGYTHPVIRRTAQMVEGMADRERSAVWGTVMSVLDLYRDPLIARHTDTSDLDLREAFHPQCPRVTTLYLVADPVQQVRLAPLNRAILQYVFATRIERGRLTKGWRILAALDDFPTYGHMDVMESVLPEGRGYGLQMALAIQDLEQLWESYGEHTSIWGNCAVKLFHAPANDTTAQRLSRMLDDETVLDESESRTWGQRRTHTVRTTNRRLRTPAELQGMSRTRQIIHVSGWGMPPIECWKLTERQARTAQA